MRGILGAGTKLSYAADWSEYSNYRPDDGSGDVFFNMDSLWASPSIDFIGIDNYMPISDWRDGHEHLDAQTAPSIYDRAYLQANDLEADWETVSRAENAMLVNALSMMAPYGPAEKQALLEAADLKTRAETLIAITEYALARENEDFGSSLQ